jgi:hypothetical protein
MSYFNYVQNFKNMLKGWADYIILDEQGIKDKDWSLDIGGLKFEFLFSFEYHVDDDLGTTQRWEL